MCDRVECRGRWVHHLTFDLSWTASCTWTGASWPSGAVPQVNPSGMRQEEVRGQAGDGLLFQPSWTLIGEDEGSPDSTQLYPPKGIDGELKRKFWVSIAEP